MRGSREHRSQSSPKRIQVGPIYGEEELKQWQSSSVEQFQVISILFNIYLSEHNFSNTHDDVETSCFNIGPQKVTSLSHSQMMSAQHQLDQYIGARNVQDALIYVEEFDDIDWVRNQQIILLLDIISRGPYEQVILLINNYQIQVHTIDVAKLINSKKYLLSKLVVKGLYNNAFISNPSFGMAIDSILQEQMEQQGELFQHQSNYASLSLYTHAHLLLQTESIHECWELVRGRLDIQG